MDGASNRTTWPRQARKAFPPHDSWWEKSAGERATKVLMPLDLEGEACRSACLRQLPPRFLQESVLLNAEASDPPASFKVVIAELVWFARLWT